MPHNPCNFPIPIKTYILSVSPGALASGSWKWDEQEAGFSEIDLVAHCGTSVGGSDVNSLDVTDIATGWTACIAVANRDRESVTEATKTARERLLFPLKGIDSDNGAKFLNGHLLRCCTREHLTFTRCRPYRKDD